MLRHVGQAQRLGVANQLPEHPAATRQRTDEPPRVLVDPHEHEALELLLALVQNAERGIARACELAGGLEHMAQHGLHVEFGNKRASDVEELAQLLFVQLTLRHDPTASPGARSMGPIGVYAYHRICGKNRKGCADSPGWRAQPSAPRCS